MTPLVALVAALCVARLTRLVVDDLITERPREWLIRREGLLSEGVRCHHCVSLWLAFPVAYGAWHWGDEAWMFVPMLALAASTVAGLVASWEE